MKDRLLNWLNTALMLNLFFVLASFGWFGIALMGRSAQIDLGFDQWYSLWNPVFMPAIGILMAGAIGSGILSWINRKLLS
jgi:TRAP-type C4-dicarboxylate transport system permease small subunit